jgi:hypothetical protein
VPGRAPPARHLRCRLNPRNPEDGEDEDSDIPAAIETPARLTGATYGLRLCYTVQLTSNATVSAWSAVAVGAAHNTPTVIAILERLRGTDTPPRDVAVHLNSHGIPMPVRRPRFRHLRLSSKTPTMTMRTRWTG